LRESEQDASAFGGFKLAWFEVNHNRRQNRLKNCESQEIGRPLKQVLEWR